MEPSTHEIPVVSYRASVVIVNDTAQAAEEQLSELADNVAEIGETAPTEQIACCWLDKRLTASDLFFGVPSILGGIVTIAAGFTNPGGKPEEAITSIIAFSCFGGVLLLIGLAILVLRVLCPSQGIEVTSDGIAVVTKRKSEKYRWDEIHKVLVSEFTENRLSGTEVTCGIEPVNGKHFGFDTSYRGDPHQVFQCVVTNCDYIVRNPEGYTRNDK